MKSNTAKYSLVGLGAVLVGIGLIWGRTGYYASQAPILIVLVSAGGLCVFIGSKIPNK